MVVNMFSKQHIKMKTNTFFCIFNNIQFGGLVDYKNSMYLSGDILLTLNL